jgi:hypothetical protein
MPGTAGAGQSDFGASYTGANLKDVTHSVDTLLARSERLGGERWLPSGGCLLAFSLR